MISPSRRNFLTRMTTAVRLAAAGALSLEVALGAEETSAPKTYTNPVYTGSMPDPFVLEHRNVYYAFGTTGGARKKDGRIFTLLRSSNLVDWQELGGALMPTRSDTDYRYLADEGALERGMFFVLFTL